MADYVLSTHYVGNGSSSSNTSTFHNVSASGNSTNTIKVTPAQNISGKKTFAPTVGSYGHFEGMPPIPYHGERAHITSNNIWTTTVSDYEKNGNFSPQVHDGPKRGGYQLSTFDTWKDAGEKPQTREYVNIPKETSYSGVVEAFEPRKLNLSKKDTQVNLDVHDMWVTDVPNNKVGIYFHKLSNLRQLLSDYHGTRHAQDVASDLKSSGNSLEEIGYLGVGRTPKRVIYGVDRTIDGKIIFLASKDANEYIVQDAEFFGVSPKETRMYHLDEEEFHIGRKSFDKRVDTEEEIATKDMQRGFYIRQIKRKDGDRKQQEIYEKFADMKKWDIETTPERYSKIFDSDDGGLEAILANEENSSSGNTQTYSQNSQPAAKSIGNILVNIPRVVAEKYTKSEKQAKTYREQESNYEENNDKPAYSGSNGKVISIKDRRKTGKAESRSQETEAADKSDAVPQENAEAPADAAIAEAA